jgi:hypothetical protein
LINDLKKSDCGITGMKLENLENAPISFDLSGEDLEAIKGGADASLDVSTHNSSYPIRIFRNHSNPKYPFPIRITAQHYPIKIFLATIYAPIDNSFK